MPFPNRALLTAPVARDLYLEHPEGTVARLPGLTNGVLQGWCTLDEDFWVALADPEMTIYRKLSDIPNAFKLRVIRIACYADAACTQYWYGKRPVNLAPGDYWKLVSGGVRNGPPQAGDRPLEWEPIHRWAGDPADTLGSPYP